ncbi:hypothetical protein PR202_gb06129 [Eleusine coracana subsp. coracana]|uniref:Uncharacterized protein n=1 Tax=Eleusine coracana subsp. coracana TaxID=191504 RepID=A0AAV5E840_ELECO|nr:hypothetical protein PR202_gb06129 [Eleusine coracana subsp. coracana]
MTTAAASLPPGDETHRRQWRYTWEALGHLPLLRLYLFPRPALPDAVPSGLRADLRLDDSLLILSFSLAGEAVSLRVPVPRVLVDPSAPVECRAAGDHVEVRLALVLPVDHPVVAAAFPPSPGADPPAPLTLRDEDEISFRTVVRDLESKSPVLQLVLLSSKAWLFSGCCYENDMDGLHGTANLQPNVKLLYSNCSNASESDLRIVEEWSSKYRAEELYMMKRQTDELIKCLSSATDNFPSSCSSLEGMCLSSLGR